MIHTEKLTRYYGDQAALESLDFHVKQGEVMGLLGPNGAGKSTTMKILTGFLPPSSGEATVAGKSLATESLAIRRLIGYLPENAPSYSDLDVYSHLAFVGRMHQIPDGTLHDRIRQMAQVCGLNDVLPKRISELSKGFRQRVGLAASMLHDPACLILDEPTSGLDPNQIIEIRHLIRHLGEKKTVLLSSHVLPEVEASCDRMIILDKGKKVAFGTVAELAAQAQGGASLDLVVRGDVAALIRQIDQTVQGVTCKNSAEAGEQRLSVLSASQRDDLPELVFKAAVASGVVLIEMQRHRASLEDMFRKLTGGVA